MRGLSGFFVATVMLFACAPQGEQLGTVSSALPEPAWHLWSTGSDHWWDVRLVYASSTKDVIALGNGRDGTWTARWRDTWSPAADLGAS